MARLWKVTAKVNVGKLPKGASVEIVKSGTNARPTAHEIEDAILSKYNIQIPSGTANSNHFNIEKA